MLKNSLPAEKYPDEINVKNLRRIVFKVALGFVIIAGLFFIAINITHKKLSRLSGTVSSILGPDVKVVTLKEISGYLQSAELNIKEYAIKRDNSFLLNYENCIANLNAEIDTLVLLIPDGKIILDNEPDEQQIYSDQLDTLRELVFERIDLFNKYIEFRTGESSSDEPSRLLREIMVSKPEAGISQKQKTTPPKKSFFSRFFSAKNKNTDSDEIAATSDSADSSRADIRKIIVQEQHQEKLKKVRKKAVELNITQREFEVTNRILSLLNSMEEDALAEGMTRIHLAIDETAFQINFISYWLTTFGVILALVFTYFIYNDVRRAMRIRKELQFVKIRLDKSYKEISDYKYALDESSIVAITDQKGIINYANDKFCKISQYSREELIGQDHRIINSGYHSKEFMRDLWITIASGKTWKGEFKNKAKDGTFYWVDSTIVPFLNERGKPYQYVSIRTVITDRKRFEEELMEARVFADQAAGIAEEAKNRAETAVATAESAVKAKQSFLANMSHEIRTPMNAIIGFTKVVLKTDLSEKQREYLSAIRLSGEALIVLINDILDLAKVNAGKITFEQIPFKIGVSISAMLFLFEAKVVEKGLKLVKEYDSKIPKIVVGDSARLHQIIMNLLSNALKFTSKGSITVSVHLLEEDDDNVTIEFAVTDTGIGIKEDKIDKIFESFQQATSSTARVYGGTGLGLAIVKELIERQGGSLRVKSKVGEGSSFVFHLSFQKTTADAEFEIAKIELDKEIKDVKILVAEDNSINQLLIRKILDDFGFERDVVENGKEAIEKLKSKSYDIILMDLQMPVMNGVETTEFIRNTMHSDIPILALTADVASDEMEKCKAAGMNDFIAKPIDEGLLYSKIAELVRKHAEVGNM